MKIHAKKNDAQKISEHEVSTFYEYPLEFDRTSVGVSEIHGEYPQKGYDTDTLVEGIWYVLSGTGKVVLNDQEFEVGEGDMVKVSPNTKFKISGSHLRLLVVSSPAWTPEQHQHIE